MYHLKEGTYLLEGRPVQKQAAAATVTMLTLKKFILC